MMWGKILGGLFGAAIAKIPGFIVGVAVGHWFDRSMGKSFESAGGFAGLGRTTDVQQGLFTYSTFAVMGHLAKADGVVTPAHIDRAVVFMQQLGLSSSQQKEAQQAFREGKAADYPLVQQLQKLRQVYRWRPDLLQLFLEIQISMAYVDGALSASESNVLRQIASQLGFSELRLQILCGRFEAEARFSARQQQAKSSADGLTDAYLVLGVPADCSDNELKKAYKKQMSQHHPDKLVSQGLPAEMMELAKQKSQKIQAAYELIKQQRSNA